MNIKLGSKNIFKYLIEVGFCQEKDIKLINIDVKSSQGRNNLITLTVNLPNGHKLFIKQDHNHHNTEKNNIINRECSLHKFLQFLPDLGRVSSLLLEIVHFDENNSILIYKDTENYINLEKYYKKNQIFPTEIAKLLGRTLAILHSKTLSSQNCYDFMNQVVDGECYYQFPHPRVLSNRLEPETIFEEFPPEGNRFLAWYHQYESLRIIVTELVGNHHHYCLTNNISELNNILISWQWEEMLSQIERCDENTIKLINWSKCSWGDPAFDLGTVVADYLLLWLGSLIMHPPIKLEESLQLATIPLEVIQPSIIALTKSYVSNFPTILEEFPNFLSRTIQFTGLALIYKMIARIQSFKEFEFLEICILEFAKSLLCQPEKSFISILGMTEETFCKLIPLSKANHKFLNM